jgi:hypothetical protein
MLINCWREFLGDDSINFCDTVVGNNVKMLEHYGTSAISGTHGLHMMVPNTTTNYPPSLYAVFNHYIWTEAVQKDRNGEW